MRVLAESGEGSTVPPPDLWKRLADVRAPAEQLSAKPFGITLTSLCKTMRDNVTHRDPDAAASS